MRATPGTPGRHRASRGSAPRARSSPETSPSVTTSCCRSGSASRRRSPIRPLGRPAARTCIWGSRRTSEPRHRGSPVGASAGRTRRWVVGYNSTMRRSLVLLALLVGPATRLPAQSPAERAAIEALRDSLTAVTDSLALKRFEAATIQVAKQQRNDPLIHCRLGFIAYRLGEVANSKAHYDDAAGEFEWAGELRPDWPYAWYGLGLAELAQGEHAVIAIENLRQQLGKDYLSKAARALARATQADPSFAQASIDLANTALTQRIQPRLEVALQAVRLAAASTAGRNAGVQLARGRVEREVGEADSSVAGFQAYLSVGGDSGLGLLELARTYYYAQRPGEGWHTYFAGARLARSAAALALYRADLSALVGPDEMAPFDGFTSPGKRAAWLERIWIRRDANTAREAGERPAEHYRRRLSAWPHS